MTAGSQSVENSGTALHYACAEARAALLAAAAKKFPFTPARVKGTFA